jgi:hypothetical protein
LNAFLASNLRHSLARRSTKNRFVIRFIFYGQDYFFNSLKTKDDLFFFVWTFYREIMLATKIINVTSLVVDLQLRVANSSNYPLKNSNFLKGKYERDFARDLRRRIRQYKKIETRFVALSKVLS